MAKKTSFLDAVKARVEENITKTRSGSGKTTYLDRFVNALTDEDGNPTEPKRRKDVIAEISAEILEETLIDEGRLEDFALTEAKDSEDDILVEDISRKVKAQVASAVANNNNSTSISYNEKYKDVWEVVKDGQMISLIKKEQVA